MSTSGKKVLLRHEADGQEREIRLHPSDVGINISWEGFEATVNMVDLGSGRGWLLKDGQSFPFYSFRERDILEIWINGQTYRFILMDPTAKAAGRQHATAVSDEVKAPMPGTILKIPVKEGDTVDANQPLIIMESMKMEMTLSAPLEGTVAHIHCHEGDMVEMGSLLVKLNAGGNA